MTTTLTTPNRYPRISLTDSEGNLLEATFVDVTSTVHFTITDPAGGGADMSIPFGDVDNLVLALSEASQRHRQNQAWQGFWARQEGQSRATQPSSSSALQSCSSQSSSLATSRRWPGCAR